MSFYIISQNMMEINRDSLFCVKEPFVKLFHRIVKEKPCAESAGKSLLTGEGNTSRRKPFYANHTISCHNLPAHSRPVLREFRRNSKPISHPEVSAHIRPFPPLSAYGSRYGSAHTPEVTSRCRQPVFRQSLTLSSTRNMV